MIVCKNILQKSIARRRSILGKMLDLLIFPIWHGVCLVMSGVTVVDLEVCVPRKGNQSGDPSYKMSFNGGKL
jgi:hypothetical protein